MQNTSQFHQRKLWKEYRTVVVVGYDCDDLYLIDCYQYHAMYGYWLRL